ncbi:MAG: hypothetical protein AB1424_08880, partial [Thermodesulfobacteriota bacterium]
GYYENRTCSQANLSRKKTPPGEFFSNDVYRLSCNFLTGQCWDGHEKLSYFFTVLLVLALNA